MTTEKHGNMEMAASASRRRPYTPPQVIEPTSPEALSPRGGGHTSSDTPSNNS